MRFAIVALTVGVAGCGGMSKENEAWYRLQVQAEAAVKSQLRDSGSAEFTGLRINVENGAVCGVVNAKNGFGGYAGATQYAFADGVAALNDGSQAYQLKSLKCIGGTDSAPDD